MRQGRGGVGEGQRLGLDRNGRYRQRRVTRVQSRRRHDRLRDDGLLAPTVIPIGRRRPRTWKTVAYNNRAGGTGQGLMGASRSEPCSEYYPSYSADDKWIAFTQAPKPGTASPDGPYYNRFGKIMVVPAGGGVATALSSNDPNACCGGDDVSRRHHQQLAEVGARCLRRPRKTYYFLIFSSARKYGDEFATQFPLPMSSASDFGGLNDSSQLWLAAVVVDNTSGKVDTYPAQYIWNQNRIATNDGKGAGIQFSNLTPAWDPFKLPPLVINEVTTEPSADEQVFGGAHCCAAKWLRIAPFHSGRARALAPRATGRGSRGDRGRVRQEAQARCRPERR